MRRVGVIFACLFPLAWAIAAAPAEFEAASFKLSAPGDASGQRMRGGFGTSDPGRIAWSNVPLSTLIAKAYGLDFDQVVGPASLKSDHYNLNATFAPVESAEQFQAMLQRLLADRLRLTLHHETREFDGYRLMLGKKSRNEKNLVAVAEVEDDRAKLRAEAAEGPPQPAVANPLDRDGCPVISKAGIQMGGRFGPDSCSRFQNFSIDELSQTLGGMLTMIDGAFGVKTRVFNQTGLEGQYNFTLRFDFIPHFPNAPPSAEPGGMTVFEALDRQLGLKLEKIREPLDVVVVDHAERVPSEN